LKQGVQGVFVAGSTGEGVSLTAGERRALAESFVRSAKGKLPIIVHVGHNSLAEARDLAAHAREIGADAISANSPSYFKPRGVDLLVDSMAEIARGAPDVPFYYYHIPSMTGVSLDIVEFLRQASKVLPNLRGLKFSDPQIHEFQACLSMEGGAFDVLWGCDEMLLGALAAGARGAVGSTYNFAAPLYLRIWRAFEKGDLDTARRLQLSSIELVRALRRHAPFHTSARALLEMIGLDCGPCRLPLAPISPGAAKKLRRDLETIGFFQWGAPI
jgi:N-acetylneuraminate lyase